MCYKGIRSFIYLENIYYKFLEKDISLVYGLIKLN